MSARRARSGFTLLELSLVCALIVIISAMAYPSFNAMVGNYRLTAAIDGTRAAWARARAAAILEGRPYRFAIIPDSGHYRVAPDDEAYWSGNMPTIDADHPATIIEESLPKGVKFNLNGNNASLPDKDTSSSDDSDQAPKPSPSEYGNPIVFLPNGEADQDVEIRFRVPGTRTTAVRLRALTGVVTVKRIEGDN